LYENVCAGAKTAVAIEACHSGAHTDLYWDFPRPDTYVMASCAAAQNTPFYEYKQWLFFHVPDPSASSMFSSYVRQALDTGDANGDGMVTLEELFVTIEADVITGSNHTSFPQFQPQWTASSPAIRPVADGPTVPWIALTSPAAGETHVEQGDPVTITWQDGDLDSNARIALCLDPDVVDQPWLVGEHTVLDDDLWENTDGAAGALEWTGTAGVEPGIYTVWAMIDDGLHEPRFSRAPGLLVIEPDGGGDVGLLGYTPDIIVQAAVTPAWLYQNAPESTQGRHEATLTLAVVSDTKNNQTYNVQLSGPAPSPTSLQVIQTVDPMVWTLRSGTAGVDPVGDVYLLVSVSGVENGGSGGTAVTVPVRQIGDIDGSGSVTAADKQCFNQRLNGVATPYPDRCYDLDGSGGAPNAVDKQVMNQVLNGVALP